MHPQSSTAALLREHYGSLPEFDLGSPWRTAVGLVLHHGRRGGLKAESWTWLPETPLSSASETAGTTPTVLARVLESHKQPAERAKVLHRLATWWDESRLASMSLSEESKFELRAATGLSLEVIDQILLLGGGRRAFPIGRAVQRIVCRHGWLDPQTEYEDWQAFLTRDSDDPQPLAVLWQGMLRVGQDFCGTTPKCEGCPLRPLLPDGGPVEAGET